MHFPLSASWPQPQGEILPEAAFWAAVGPPVVVWAGDANPVVTNQGWELRDLGSIGFGVGCLQFPI